MSSNRLQRTSTFPCRDKNVSVQRNYPLFLHWSLSGAHTFHFFDILIPILMQELPKEVIISTRKMINRAKDLNGFFLGKMQLLNKKMKTITIRTLDFIPKIIDDNNNSREW